MLFSQSRCSGARLYFLHHACCAFDSALHVLQWFRAYDSPSHLTQNSTNKTVHAFSRSFPPSTPTAPQRVRHTRCVGGFTPDELTYVWCHHAPYALAHSIARNIRHHPWMALPWTTFNTPSILRLSLVSALRWQPRLAPHTPARDTRSLRGLTAALCLLSGCDAPWVRHQLGWVGAQPYKTTLEAHEMRPYFTRCGVQFLRTMGYGGGEGTLDAVATANVLVLGEPTNFVTSLRALQHHSGLRMHSSFILSYMTCWGLKESDFTCLVDGKVDKSTAEQIVMHAYEIHEMHCDATDAYDAFEAWNTEMYGIVLQAYYVLGKIGDAWKFILRAIFDRELLLPAHCLWIALDMRNHLSPPEPYIAEADYVRVLAHVYGRYILKEPSVAYTEREVRVLAKLAECLTNLSVVFSSHMGLSATRILQLWFQALRNRWPTQEVRDSSDDNSTSNVGKAEDTTQYSSHNCALFVARLLSLCMASGSETDCERAVNVLAEIGICRQIHSSAKILIFLLKSGWIRLTVAVYDCVPKRERDTLLHLFHLETLERLYHALSQSLRREEAVRVRDNILQRRKRENRPSAAASTYSRNSSQSSAPYWLSVKFQDVLPTPDDLKASKMTENVNPDRPLGHKVSSTTHYTPQDERASTRVARENNV